MLLWEKLLKVSTVSTFLFALFPLFLSLRQSTLIFFQDLRSTARYLSVSAFPEPSPEYSDFLSGSPQYRYISLCFRFS